ncbi:hypothetical protein NKG94_16275 [Micromonospora sp. M12]
MDEVLEWFDEQAGSGPREIDPLDNQTELRQALVRHGYEENPEAAYFAYHALSLVDLPKPSLPEGFTVRAVRGPAIWLSGSRCTSGRGAPRRSVRNRSGPSWPHGRTGRSWTGSSRGRTAASSPTALSGTTTRTGSGSSSRSALSPSSAAGAVRAVCLAALHVLRDLGGGMAVVSPRGDDAYPIPKRSTVAWVSGSTPARCPHQGLADGGAARPLAYESPSWLGRLLASQPRSC